MFKRFRNLLLGEANGKSDLPAMEHGSDTDLDWQTQIARADALWEQGKISEALSLYGVAIEQNPALLEIQQRLAERIKRQGDLAVAYEKLAVGLKNKGKIEQAANYYRQAIEIKALTGNTRDKLLNKSIVKTNKPPIPLASLKEAAFSFQPLLKKEMAIVASSPNTSEIEIEADVSPTFRQRLKPINPQQAKDIDWETAQVYLQKALEHLERQEWEQAALACKQATQIMPNMAKAYKIWGNALQRMGKTGQAMSCYAKAVEVQPNLAEVYAGIADIYVRQQKWQQAIKHYQKALIINPSAKIYRSLADVWRQLGETEKVEFNLSRAAEFKGSNTPVENAAPIDIDAIDPSQIQSVEAYCKIAQQLEKQDEWQQAAKYYRLALELNISQTALPGQDLTQVKLNGTQNSTKQSLQESYEQPKTLESQLDKAIKRYHQQVKQQPNSAKIHTDLGNLYAKKGKWQYAIACYRRAIKFDRQYAKAHLNLGRILFKIGKQEEFIQEMQLALSLQPKIGTALDRFYLGNALVAKNQSQQAIEFYYQAIVLNPRFVQSYYRISEILSQRSKHTEAINFLEQGINHNPQDPESYFLLGQQWEALKDWENAVKAYSQVLKLEPQYPEALRKLNYALAQKLKLNHQAKSNSST
jgi:tetratricopeptide (TPR) repeat protein